MNMLLLIASLLIAFSARAQERFTSEQREARFYYDLGPNEMDVSSYPKEQQDNYRIFAKACSQCHTLARPLHSPIVSREDWTRYVRRMHAKTKMRAGAAVGKEAAKASIDFLVYDSQLRKVKGKAGFDAKTAELKALFDEVRRERARMQMETDKKKTQEPAPYMGGK